MIKGLDAQIMTQRTMEYSKDVSAIMRRDEVNNEFADRMNKLTAKQEAQSVTPGEKAEHSVIRERQEKEKGEKKERGKGKRRQREFLPLYNEDGLPSVGMASEEKLLDIEI